MNATTPLHVLRTGVVVPSTEPDWNAGISPGDKRRSPRIWQMASVAVARALDGLNTAPRSLVSATALGALDETRLFLEKVFTEGLGSPRNFIASVHNSMAGKLALDHNIQGPNLTLCDGQNSLAAALVAADLLTPEDFPTVVVAVDESIPLLEDLLPYFAPQCRAGLRDGWEDAAVALVLSPQASDAQGTVSAVGPVPGGEDPAARIEQLAATLGSDVQAMDLSETSSSFVQPAMSVCQLLTAGDGGRFAVPCHAPTTGAVAIIDVCV